MSDHKNIDALGIPENWDHAARAILDPKYKTQEERAKAIGLTRPGLYKIRKDPEFQQYLKSLRKEQWEAVTDAMRQAAVTAVKSLYREAVEGERSADRVAAARSLLQLTVQNQQTEVLTDRLDAIEQAIKETK